MALEWLKTLQGDRIVHLYAEYDEPSVEVTDFWCAALNAYVNERKCLDFQYTEVEKAFVYDGVYPTSLKQSISLLEQRGYLISVKDIQQEKKSDDSLVSMLISSFSTFFSPSKAPPADNSNDLFLFSSVLAEISSAVAAAAQARNDYDLVFSTSSALSSVNTFHSFITSSEVINAAKSPIIKEILSGLTEQQACLVMDYLVNQNKGRYSDPQHNNIYSAVHTGETSSEANIHHSSGVYKLLATPKSLFHFSARANTAVIDNAYISIYVLKHSLDSVDRHIQKVQDKIQSYASQALAAHRGGSPKEAVLGILHLKKIYTQNLQKLMGTKFHLEKSLITLEETKQNVVILEAYQTATLSMKTYRQQHELLKNGADGVADTLDAFQDELDQLTEVNEMIEDVVVGKIDVDEQEGLEKELEELMGAQQTTGIAVRYTQETMVQLPSVPSGPISVSQVHLEERREEFENTQATLS
eukprot:gene32410-39192_t